MTFLIAAAGTGGHVFPGLAVGEALVELGVPRAQVNFVGGDRLEARIYPEAGFPFLRLELRGLKRSLTPKNLSLPRVVWRARDAITGHIASSGVMVVLGMGGYVTLPAALAARRAGVPLCLAEQNAGAGLSNRVASRWARHCFTSFPDTEGLERGEWVGNPVRRELARFDRARLQAEAAEHYGLGGGAPVLGVFGGSLGAGVLNTAARELVASWRGASFDMVHLTGPGNTYPTDADIGAVRWRQVEFEDRMDLFYAACDLVVARAGGGVAELTATGTPSILVPGQFGSSGHQDANAEFLRAAGAAVVVTEDQLGSLTSVVRELLFDPGSLARMESGAKSVAKPEAAITIARAILDLAS